MKNYESLSHTRYDCKYHVVFIPKYRRKKIYGAIRRPLGEISRAGEAEGKSHLGRAFEGRSRPQVHQHSTEVCGVECGGLHEGEKRNFGCAFYLFIRAPRT